MPGLLPTEDEDELWGQLAIAPLQAPMLQDPSANAMASMPVAAQVPSAPQMPAASPQASPELDALEALAAAGAPPESKSRDWDRAGLILAMFADAVANGGLRAGQYAQQLRQIPDEDVENYQLRMGDAYKRAQIQSMLRQGKGADPRELAIREAANKNEEMRLGLQGRDIALNEQKFKAQGDAAAAMRDPESPITQRMRQTAVSMGADPAMVAGMTAEDIMKWRPQIGQAANADRSNKAWHEKYGVGGTREQVKIAEEGRASGRKLEEEARASQKLAAQTAIPGWRVVQGHAPTNEKSMKAREMVVALGNLEDGASKMTEINGKLNALQAKLGPNWNSLLGDDETARLLVDSRLAHDQIVTSVRKLNELGAPQNYELSRLEALFPQLDQLSGILTAGHVYPSLASTAREKARRQLSAYSYEPDTGPQPDPQGGLGVTSGPVPKLNFNPDDDRDLGVVYE